MTSTRIATVAIIVVGGSLGFAQGQKPNFSGTWLLVAPAEAAVQPPGQEETITQTDTTITFGHPSEGGGHQKVCGLDGQERESNIAGFRLRCRGAWEGRKLVLAERTVNAANTAVGSTETTTSIHLDENGSLVMEIKPPISNLPGGPAKLVWRKR
jgi:hypothetical protein